MERNTMTHNQAMLYLLMQNANRQVSLPQIMRFTNDNCNSVCAVVHSRASDLRKIYGYNITNYVRKKNGRQTSTYQLNINKQSLNKMRQLFGRGKQIPHFTKVIQFDKKPIQNDLFERGHHQLTSYFK